jgi:EAL domain-containing protein (putative c-di-GMP-specific phosphodiesterase class I)
MAKIAEDRGKEQLAYLLKFRCLIGQGFHFSRPPAAEDAIRLLLQGGLEEVEDLAQ